MRDDAVQSEGIGPVLGAGRENTGKGIGRIVAGMDFEHGAIGAMQPGHDDELVAGGDTAQGCPRKWDRMSIHASGAPWSPCLGASAGSGRVDRMIRIGRSRYSSFVINIKQRTYFRMTIFFASDLPFACRLESRAEPVTNSPLPSLSIAT